MNENRRITLKVEGMNCASCAGRVERAAMSVPGVESAQVNLPAKSMSFQGPQELTEGVLQAITEAGYPASLPRSVQRMGFLVQNMKCAGCQGRVNAILEKVEGIDHYNVNLMTKRLSLDYDPTALDLNHLKSTLEQAGYPLKETGREEVKEGMIPPFAKEIAEQKTKLLLSALFTLPLFFLAMAEMVGIALPLSSKSNQLPFFSAQLALLLPVIWVGRDFYLLGFKHLWHKSPNMDSLIAVGTTSAIFFSLYHGLLMFQGQLEYASQLYFETAGVILTLILFGRYLEGISKEKSFGAVKELIGLQSEEARLIRDGEEVLIPRTEVIPGDLLWVKAGETLPVDGRILKGQGSINESMITGESLPQERGPGEEVIGGCILAEGHLEIEATKVGKDSTLAKMIALVEEAQNSKAPIARKADLVAAYFVPAVMLAALISGLSWFVLGYGTVFSVKIFIAVMVIACPCALGLATPTAILVGTSRGAKLGILIKGGESLERLAGVTDLIFDKTGTLTLGEPKVEALIPFQGRGEEELLRLAACLEKGSEHLYAKAILERAEGLKLSLPQEVKILPGKGIQGEVEGRALSLGNPTLMRELGLMQELPEEAQAFGGQGHSLIFLAEGKNLLGFFSLKDLPRPEAKEAMAELKALGITPHMLTGDNQETAREIAGEVGIEHVFSEVLPGQKMEKVKELQGEGRIVAMVGDGINDAPALTQADVGIALGSGSSVSMESAQMVLPTSNLKAVARGVRLSRATLTNIKQNLFWAFAYNVMGIPFAAGVFYVAFGWTLNPMIAALAMAFSSVSVVTNALRLHRFR